MQNYTETIPTNDTPADIEQYNRAVQFIYRNTAHNIIGLRVIKKKKKKKLQQDLTGDIILYFVMIDAIKGQQKKCAYLRYIFNNNSPTKT